MSKNANYRYISAVTGHFVTTDYGTSHPSMTVRINI